MNLQRNAKAIRLYAPRNVHGQWISAIEIDTGHPTPLRIMASADEALVRLIYAYADRLANRYVEVRQFGPRAQAPVVGNIFGDVYRAGKDIAEGVYEAGSDIVDTAAAIASSDAFKAIAGVSAFIPGGQGIAAAMAAGAAVATQIKQGKDAAEAGAEAVQKGANALLKAAGAGDPHAIVKVANVVAKAQKGDRASLTISVAMQRALKEATLLKLAARDFGAFLRALQA